MRLLGKLAIGGGAVSAVTAGALIVGGVFATSATLVAVDPGAKPAQADGLTAFDDCGALLDWYVDHNLSEVGPYGWGGPIMYLHKGYLNETVPQAMDLRGTTGTFTDAAANLADTARASSGTGTNTQEIDVDEPDVAKTDGKLLVRLTRPHDNNTDQMLAVSDVTGTEKETLGRLHLPETSYDSQLLLVGSHVVVTQSVSGYGNPIAYGRVASPLYAPQAAGTRVLDIDVSDPAHPTLVGTDVYSGSLISARQYGDTVRLVTDTGRPDLKWWNPGQNKVSPKIAIQHNKQVLRNSTIDDWLPSVRGASGKKRLLDCSQVLHPKAWAGSDTIAVTTFKAGSPADRNSIGITASGGVVYSSVERLYVASTEWGYGPVQRGLVDRAQVRAPGTVTTDLHAFKLDGTSTTYLGSGHIDGSIRDRWSLDEHNGNLRVAWSNSDGNGRTQNGVSVLKEQDNALREIGTLDSLGINEDIQSVRWFDDLAVVVTYRQIDPLYTIDLSDPTRPHLLGALKIPGYSGYLHPIGHDLLLGLGVSGDGLEPGAQAAVFDIKNLAKPDQVSRVGYGASSSLDAISEPREFTWLPGVSTGLTVVNDWSSRSYRDRLRVEALTVSSTGELHSKTVARLDEGWQPRILPLDDNRVAVVDGYRVQLLDLG